MTLSYTKAQRMLHPHLRLIPESLWFRFSNVFRRTGGLGNHVLQLMDTPEDKLITRLREVLRPTLSIEEKSIIWLAIVLTHPDLDETCLQAIKSALAIPFDEFFSLACAYGKSSVLEKLIETIPANLRDVITQGTGLLAAAENNHLDVINQLITLDSHHLHLDTILNACFSAAELGHLDVVRRLAGLELVPREALKKRLTANGYWGFSVLTGHQEIIKHFLTLFPEMIGEIAAPENYDLLSSAAMSGNKDLVAAFLEADPDMLKRMVAANNYKAFEKAALVGQLDILKYLIEQLPAETRVDQLKTIIKAERYFMFSRAIESGNVDTIKFLESQLNEVELAEALSGLKVTFHTIVSSGKKGAIEYLKEAAPEALKKSMEDKVEVILRLAARDGDGDVIALLISTIDRELILRGIKDNHVFMNAIQNEQLSVVKQLIKHSPEAAQDMIANNKYAAFSTAAKEGALPIMQYLMETIQLDKVNAMIEAENYHAFHQAHQFKHRSIINWLLTFPIMLSYAEHHEGDYGEEYVHPFISKTLAALRNEKADFEARSPHAVFDLKPEDQKATLYFYCLRNLIRRNNPALHDDILLLLDIPAVKELAHVNVTPGSHNELLRLAMALGNQDAIQLLMNIPAVRQLAADNGYYQEEENRRGINLRALANDPESSMHALSTEEEQRVSKARARYQPMIAAQGGVDNVMSELRKALEERYKKKPATIMRTGPDGNPTSFKLPLKWEVFHALTLNGSEKKAALNALTLDAVEKEAALQALTLNAAEKTAALKAYYQHSDHTALRYLAKPNHWMHDDAHYVTRDASGGWSSFEGYGPLIAMFYLAAKDEAVSAGDGARLDHFIDELAHIGRAHNWDNTRKRTVNGKTIEEQYDNLEGDRPSCYSGVKRRLFQSVLDHPLLRMPTKDDIKEDIRGFVRNHVVTQLRDPALAKQIKEAWALNIDGDPLNAAQEAALKTLDVTPAQRAAFKSSLAVKYGTVLSLDFSIQIDDAFRLITPGEPQIFNLGHFVGDLLVLNPAEAVASVSPPSSSAARATPSPALAATGEPPKDDAAKKAFLDLLDPLRDKINQRLNNKHPDACTEAQNIIDALTLAANTFFDDPSAPNAPQTFRSACNAALDGSKSPQLQQHRGILGAFGAAINQFFQDLFSPKPWRNMTFFDTRTHSAKIVDTLKEEVDEEIKKLEP